MRYPHVALVTDTDIEAAVTFARTASPTGFMELLFDGPTQSRTAYLHPRSYGAVGLTLTQGGPGLPDFPRLLPVLNAVGRAQAPDAGLWMPVGAVMLAGEIAARYLHQQLTREHHPAVLAPLRQAIAVNWPRYYIPPHLTGPAAGNLLRLTNGPQRRSFAPAEIQAMRLIARMLPGGHVDQGLRLRCATQLCGVFAPGRGRYRAQELSAVREETIAFRADGRRADEQHKDTAEDATGPDEPGSPQDVWDWDEPDADEDEKTPAACRAVPATEAS
ncbi:hypothetical protein ACFYNX_26040 [Streptomyces sp. NPDC007872]|uniref:hypothetical protein n=1 Tax=Streptomyces sp. NPDC007872 TaxID=3364782 RepID=UPI0036A7E986